MSEINVPRQRCGNPNPLRLQQHALVRKCNVDNRLSTEDGRQLHGPIDCCRSRRYGGCDRCSSVAVRR
ncbi:hypothetical protein Y032_0605g570 [Ancylostoma ceylanicum]|uniref:Uncharacterized protein n=1 Tax=Ancylostoma ceylanicum TaxID=53326 RepID=A0A016WLT5_9BILA|nr:hypothetical protein Y032_0605g570 [Ancylostoma ceylanicum]